MPEFSNKIALVTGAATGIGRATAIALAAEGAHVIIADINDNGSRETLAKIRESGGEGQAVYMDVTDPANVAEVFERVVAEHRRLDIAVNNAGIGGGSAPVTDIDPADWQRVFDINVTGVWRCMRHEIPAMLAGGGGAIVNVASVAGLVAFPGFAAYAASKHAVVGLSKSAAVEYARHGIRINAVCPAFTDTPMVDALKSARPDLADKLHLGIPMKRLGKPAEIADGIVYLCSEKASFIVGHTLPLDGGLVAV